jgi:hypothetical protein
VLLRRERERLLVRDRRVGFVLLIWAIYTIAGGLTDPFIDNGAHIGGALGGALIASRLHPVVLSPLPPERAASLRRWLGLVVRAARLRGGRPGFGADAPWTRHGDVSADETSCTDFRWRPSRGSAPPP